ncbi:MAG: hypothetical protein AAF679_09090 [Pseudomonadota bacterium]
MIRSAFKANAPEIQFWGYESGNVLAALAGAGGFAAVWADLQTVQAEGGTLLTLLALVPDATVAIGLVGLVLGISALRYCCGTDRARSVIDRTTVLLALVILTGTLLLEVSWITLAAVFFVTGSTLLRYVAQHPVFLKLGSLMLAAGGLSLTGFGVSLALAAPEPALLPILTVLTGIYVAGSSLLTYQGGMVLCATASAPKSPALAAMAAGLSRLDEPFQAMALTFSQIALVWVPGAIKDSKPFLTSMWARLPWRVLTALAALATGTPEGLALALANGAWALGDVSIGALDWDDAPETAPKLDGLPA